MNRTEWLACRDPLLMLREVRLRASQRKLRLFACACVRRHEEVLAERIAKFRELFVALEDFADAGSLSVHAAAAALIKGLGFTRPWDSMNAPSLLWPVVLSLLEEEGWNAACAAAQSIARMTASDGGEAERLGQAELAHDLFDDLFRPPVLLAWVEDHRELMALAQTIYEEHSFGEMPVLGDALEEAGCTDEEVLEHCREVRPHARGCWVLDAVLGRS